MLWLLNLVNLFEHHQQNRKWPLQLLLASLHSLFVSIQTIILHCLFDIDQINDSILLLENCLALWHPKLRKHYQGYRKAYYPIQDLFSFQQSLPLPEDFRVSMPFLLYLENLCLLLFYNKLRLAYLDCF